jgi:ABC-type antimicrobial peptide transport system permease subunit
MACNCKRAKKFEEKYGVPQEETISSKIVRYFFKIFFFIAAILIAIVVVPYIMCYALYSIFFGDNKITLPKFLRKYLE